MQNYKLGDMLSEVVCTVEVAHGIWKWSLKCKGLHSMLEHEVCSWQRLLQKVQMWQEVMRQLKTQEHSEAALGQTCEQRSLGQGL